jgi:hypothetical protein
MAWSVAPPSGTAQQAAQPAPGRLNAVNGFGPGAAGPGAIDSGNPNGGGAANADFDSLIDLITSSVERDSWQENGTGEGEIQPFAINGVYIDAAGALHVGAAADKQHALAAVKTRGLSGKGVGDAAHSQSSAEKSDAASDARKTSPLRYVSLPRLEAAIANRQQAHQPLDAEMLTLAGLQRVSFVLVYPETRDLVLAGPAGDWQAGAQGALVSSDTGRPVVRLDDLLVLMRRQRTGKGGAFGCSIVPRQEALAKTQEFLDASAQQPLEPWQRKAWLGRLRDTLGVQDVAYFNISPDTRVAGVLLAADFHMKLIGMGLADGVPGIKSYLATVHLGKNGAAPPMNILRWWFSMPASTVEASAQHDIFALPQRSVQVLSENELLAARGRRVHTGQSDDLTKKFAESFTAQFPALVEKYPIYGQLERVFELALALAVIDREGLADQAGWTPTLLLDGERLRLPRAKAARAVETVINHKVIGGRKIIAGISGGVVVDGAKSLTVASVQGDAASRLANVHRAPQKADAAKNNTPDAPQGQGVAWWWD